MAKSPLRNLIRNFPENGPKLLLENGANVHEMFRLLHEPRADAIDFSALTVERTHFVTPDYAHVAVDLLLKAPFRVNGAGDPRSIFIYLLIEHQSTPERFFMLRLGEYLFEVYKMQKRAWDKKPGLGGKFLLQPVMPIVLYTGERSWENVEAMTDLVEAGPLFREMIPAFKPHFLNLRGTSREKLANDGGFFGQVLLLIRERHAEPAAFQQTLREVVTRLELMPATERNRWVEFLSYIVALVYHARKDEEQTELRELVDRSIQTDPHRKEYQKMGRTIAEMYMDQGEQRGKLKEARAILLLLLRERFKKVPRKVEAHIAAADKPTLKTWMKNFVDAETLAEVGIPLD
jgi:Putative transposase, YhgA-like